ncbi:MAG: ABC transporter permease [Bacillota bacterium]
MRNGSLAQNLELNAVWRRVRHITMQMGIQQFMLLLALVVIFTVMGLINPRFLSVANMVNIARQISINVVIATGATFCILSGGIDLSVGSVGIMCGCLTAIFLIRTQLIFAGILLGFAIGACAGLINGLLISRLRVPPFVVTLGMMTIGRGIALLTTGGLVISGLPQAFTVIGTGWIGPIPVPVVIAVFVAVAGHFLLTRTEFGLRCYAVGGNYEAARMSGIDTAKIITSVYVMQGTLAALGGLILTGRVLSAQPALMGQANLDAIAATVIGGTSLGGGKGNIVGTVLGSILVGSLYNALNIIGVGYYTQLVVIGCIIILAVYIDTLTRK